MRLIFLIFLLFNPPALFSQVVRGDTIKRRIALVFTGDEFGDGAAFIRDALKKNNVKPSFFIQFGYPGEDKADIARTVEMINTLLPFEIGISVSYPLPGTVFYDRVKADLHKKTNWTDSDEMALMFSNTFPPSYYKQLHKYVHQNYHKHLAKNSMIKLIKNPLSVNASVLRKALSVLYHAPATFFEKLKLTQLEKA